MRSHIYYCGWPVQQNTWYESRWAEPMYMCLCLCALVTVIVAVFFSHSRAIHSSTELLVQYLILHIGIHDTQHHCRHQCSSRLSHVLIYYVFFFTRIFADVVDRVTIAQDMLRFINISLLCLYFLYYSVHSIPNWSFDGVSVLYGYWNDTDVYIFYGSLGCDNFFSIFDFSFLLR